MSGHTPAGISWSTRSDFVHVRADAVEDQPRHRE